MQAVAAARRESVAGARESFAAHWREYLIEGWALGTFMISACVFAVLLEHPASPINHAMENSLLRRAGGGLAMGLTSIVILLSPWGKRSGAHLNPAVTLTFFSLGKVAKWDAVFYGAFQVAGGIAGVALAGLLIGPALHHSAVNFAVTLPGPRGPLAAFAAETGISTLMMLTVLTVSNTPRLSPYTPYFAGSLIALFITFEAPLSGMSMNPARTLGSAVNAGVWTSLWIYFTAPVLGMILASRLYVARRGIHRVFCAKLHHHNQQPCIFRCRFGAMQ
ncbi:MAG: aquaporin [Bryobacteraceae bacterium]|nr:aquaporin [Bryobacteraceae bacterium]